MSRKITSLLPILLLLTNYNALAFPVDLELKTDLEWSDNEPIRVNGGQLVNETVPFQVSLQVQRRGRWRHFCGGSIVSPQHVLTAAHCVEKMRVEDISVLGGTLNWKTGGMRHRIAAKQVHPQYTMSPRIINDIAVLKISPAFRLHRASIGTIGLGGPNRIGNKVAVRLTGWGSTTPTAANATLPDQLQALNYRTISNGECAQKGFRVTANEICALASRGQGACVGDSGGPLVLMGAVPQLVGIVSYGSATCAQGRPDVYTRVSSFLPYINKVLQQDLA
ncbi:chymotrypsin-1 [Scaptodrosophila lebanonensis]|uniref:trypsin n=1 Tax=Drosophila lebanonensis TaxID=7225 RepID=A0A6J2TC08_DROLE|nr:chymotrypsin-1 [Scaptodrosophila lebanonensis]